MTTTTTFCLNQPLIQNKTFCLQINTFDVIILLGVNDTGVQPKETTILNTSANRINEITKETRKKVQKKNIFQTHSKSSRKSPAVPLQAQFVRKSVPGGDLVRRG